MELSGEQSDKSCPSENVVSYNKIIQQEVSRNNTKQCK